jgi:tetratricopeptide (TPR) repeat protein
MFHLHRIFPATLLLAVCALGSAHAQKPASDAPSPEAQRYFVQGNTRFHQAQSPDDYRNAAALYKQALDLAPHFGNAWYNLAKVQEKLEQFDDAIASLEHFLADSPNDPEASATQNHVYELELKRDDQAKAAAARRREEELREQAEAEAERRRSESPQVKGYWVDPATGLMWSYETLNHGADGKDRNPQGLMPTWYEAASFCKNFRLGGYSDWRLPELDELQGIYDPAAGDRGNWTKSGLGSIGGFPRYWSGTAYGSRQVWSFSFDLRTQDHFRRDGRGSLDARCVRRPGQ